MPDRIQYKIITTHQELTSVCEAIREQSEWMGFDTEFIGERRYIPLLCLVQVSASTGTFLIDTLEIDDIRPLINLLEDENILKITHAGDNDYKLFHRLYQSVPKNVIDTQIAAGFLGLGYPASFQKIINRFLKIRISKAETVSDWQARPIRSKQLDYAAKDVIYLYDLWEKQKRTLERKNRIDWVKEECAKYTRPEYYDQDILKQVRDSRLMLSLDKRERMMLIRLHIWRDQEAAAKNTSREKILQAKLIPAILKTIKSGKKSLKGDRRIPQHIAEKYWGTFNQLYQKSISQEEQDILDSVPERREISEEQNIVMDLLNQIFKLMCNQNKVAATLLLPRSEFNKMKQDMNYVPELLGNGWRSDILGENILDWLSKRKHLRATFNNNEFRIGLEAADKSTTEE